MTSIGNSAFYGCSSLTSVTIPGSVTSISDYAFQYCRSLTNLRIDTNNPNYSSSDDGKILYNKGKTKLIAYPSATGDVTIPDSVTSIGYGAFQSCSSLTSVVIGDSVTSIGQQAFRECSKLTNVTIPDSVTYIGKGAFYKCSSLIYNEYDNGLYLGNADNPYLVFVEAKYTSITSCEINNRTKIILNNAFSGCSSLTSIVIGDSVTSIGSSAFYNCGSLTNVTIGNSVTSIGDSAFSNCSSLTRVTIPDSVTSIGSEAFEYCSSLTSVTFKDTNNWYYTSNRDYTGGTAVDVTDKAQNATYLKSTYYDKYWYKQ